MTSGVTPAPPGPGPHPVPGALTDPALREAVQAALAAEHAAIWSYGLASAFLPAAGGRELSDAATVHRERRDLVATLLERAGVPAPPAAAAYLSPAPVGDALSATVLLGVVESDVAGAWRAVCERTRPEQGEELRGPAVDAVISAAALGSRWRRRANRAPVVPTFPGAPGA